MCGDESEAVAPLIWLYQTVDAQKEEVFFPDLLITLRSYVTLIYVCDKLLWFLCIDPITLLWHSTKYFQPVGLCDDVRWFIHNEAMYLSSV